MNKNPEYINALRNQKGLGMDLFGSLLTRSQSIQDLLAAHPQSNQEQIEVVLSDLVRTGLVASEGDQYFLTLAARELAVKFDSATTR